MRSGLRILFVGLAVAFTAANSAGASSEEFPLESGTYARVYDWCKVNRADQNSPVYKEKRAYINLSPTEINWDESVGKITDVGVDGNKITLSVEMTEGGSTKPVTLPLIVHGASSTLALCLMRFVFQARSQLRTKARSPSTAMLTGVLTARPSRR